MPEFPCHRIRRLRDKTFGNQLSLKKHSVSQKSVQAKKEYIYPGLPHFSRIFYQLSHKGSPRILEWVAYPFSGDLANPGIKLMSPALQVNSVLTELLGKLS